MLQQLNHTIIALVPKSEHSPSVTDYRSISCCNVIYKVITKIIADRLSPALEQLIDSSQAAFVGGRNITDNIFLAQEMVRQYSRKRISPCCTINVDIRKAFDSVSWTFLSDALNGSLHGLFLGKKGLRQGDQMSPVLFLLCMEYLLRLIKRNTSNSDFNFHLKCEKLKITHLLFADDLMLFSRRELPSIHILMECLEEFRDVSGLAVNTVKSNIFMAGIQDDILDEALAMTEFARSHMPVREWSAFGSKSSLSQWQLLKRSTVCARPSYGIPREHRWPGRKFAIRRRKAVWVSGISNPGMLLSLPESYGTFIARQTPYRPNAATHHMGEWTDSKGPVTSKAYEYFKSKLPRQPLKASIWKAFIPLKYSFILWLGLRESAVKCLKKEKTGSSVQNKARHLALACTVYSLWRHRNEIIFEGKAPNPDGLVISIKITVYKLILTLFAHGF
ncbi:UNVERIFIED_CONTAM: Retrovirus-related Pol polyprotein from type-2 retrotransposable element R2DM [Sesamum radiatum]|uniref:Retrovirus-related Pol polyprotein from type-2 retrotransposable element R2DM n=1 Tax=Sesamum radiatum TaxID=300843 RepID=A0AAW2N1E0_SESRA